MEIKKVLQDAEGKYYECWIIKEIKDLTAYKEELANNKLAIEQAHSDFIVNEKSKSDSLVADVDSFK